MSVITITVPADLERRSLPDRLRFWADALKGQPGTSLAAIATLEEAATEVTLGQCTQLTYRGDDVA
jgi:hypothetical protein